jgi:hypothetical protein
MTNETHDILNNSLKASSTDDLFGEILLILRKHFDESIEDIELTKKLSKLGAKTQLHQIIEKALEDSLKATWDASVSIDKQFMSILDLIIQAYFKELKDVVETVYKTKTTGNVLHYSVVLKEDNMENRNAVYEFFDDYETSEYSEKYPIYFQVVPPGLINKINTEKKIY